VCGEGEAWLAFWRHCTSSVGEFRSHASFCGEEKARSTLKKRLRNARLGSEARNRRDVTLLRERLLSILSSLSSLKGKRRESSSDEV
jgi:hypothetical protein